MSQATLASEAPQHLAQQPPASESSRAPKPSRQRNPNTIVWFELPVSDLDRAARFYEFIFATKLLRHDSFPDLAVFPRQQESSVSGALTLARDSDRPGLIGQPTSDGAVVYLNCDGLLDDILKRTVAIGGKILQEVAQLPNGMGFFAQIRDLDGNRVGLHATF